MTYDPATIRPRQRGGYGKVNRYGGSFVAAIAREGLFRREIAKVAHPEKLTPEAIAAIRRQTMVNQAAIARAGRARKQAQRALAEAAKTPSDALEQPEPATTI